MNEETCRAFNVRQQQVCGHRAIGYDLEKDIPLCRFHIPSRVVTRSCSRMSDDTSEDYSVHDTSTSESVTLTWQDDLPHIDDSIDSAAWSPPQEPLMFFDSDSSDSESHTNSTSGGDCVICQRPMWSSSEQILLLCGHPYHSRCIRRWQCVSDQCPCCRKPIQLPFVVAATAATTTAQAAFFSGARVQQVLLVTLI
jgi:hypothetical protein